MTLMIDVHEPEDAIKLMVSSVPCSVEILNEYLFADYKWKRADGGVTQVERKTWGEILANVDAVEDQLRRHKKNQPEARLLFVLEGMVDVTMGGTYQLRAAKGGSVYVRGFKSATRISRIYSWLYNASEYVEVFQTGNYEMTCQFLVQAYKQDQKEEPHETFQRYFKKIVFHPNPQVLALMGMIPGLGEVRSEALIAEFSTVWGVLSSTPAKLAQVPGIGPKMSNTILQRIGRYDF